MDVRGKTDALSVSFIAFWFIKLMISFRMWGYVKRKSAFSKLKLLEVKKMNV
jgi:hypothetical protein